LEADHTLKAAKRKKNSIANYS